MSNLVDANAEQKLLYDPSTQKLEWKPLSTGEKIGIIVGNVLLPGSGTAYFGITRKKWGYVVLAIVSFILWFVVIGWFVSVGMGIYILTLVPRIIPI